MASTTESERGAWRSITNQHSLPPEGVAVETKIDDGRGCRNVAILKRRGGLWYFDDESMYVYYAPTHWRPLHHSVGVCI